MGRAIAIMVVAAAGLVVLGTMVPGQRKLRISFDADGPDARETRAIAEDLLASALAGYLDPSGDERLRHALAIEDEERHHQLELSDLTMGNDLTLSTDDHQIQIAHAKLAAMIALGMLLFSSLVCFALWWRDSGNREAWYFAVLPSSLALFPTGYVLTYATGFGLTLLAFYLTSLATIGRESVRALRLRTPDELPDPPAQA